MTYQYTPQGTCCQLIEFTIEADILTRVRFHGGCSGNLQGIAALVEGMNIAQVVSRLSGIKCGLKGTSCPDQLAKALMNVKY